MLPATRGHHRGALAPFELPGAIMRVAIAIFVIVGIFLEPAWSQVLPAAGF